MENPLALDKVKADLGGKPVWFWGLLGGIFVLAGYYVFKSNKNATAAASIASGQATIPDTMNAALPNIGQPYSGVVSNADNALGTDNIETVESWKGRGVVIGSRSGRSGIFMNNALTKYLNGTPLTQDEADAVNGVISAIGLPPGGQDRVVTIIKNTPTKTNKTVTTKKPVKKTVNNVAPVTKTTPTVKPKKKTIFTRKPAAPKTQAKPVVNEYTRTAPDRIEASKPKATPVNKYHNL